MAEKSKERIFVIGLDGGTWNVLKLLMQKGIMPNLEKLTKRGVTGNLKSTIPPVTAPAWASFMTGKNPGKHGLFGFLSNKNNSGFWEPVDATMVKEKTLWEVISERGKRVAVINVPLTYPPKKVNGIMVTGMLTPRLSRFTYPEDFGKEINNKVKQYMIDVIWKNYGYRRKGEEKLIKDLTSMTKKREELVKYVLDKGKWDFFIVVFIGTDRIQHSLWKYIAGQGCESVNPSSQKYMKLVLEYYKYIDDIIGEIATQLENNTSLYIVSDHGFGALHKKVSLNNWLADIGLLFKRERRTGQKTLKYFLSKTNFRLKTHRRLLKEMKRFGLDRILTTNSLKSLGRFSGSIDWTRTKAFSRFNNDIHINLRGREETGIVNYGKEYEYLRDEIIDKLSNLTDPSSGEKIINKVHRREEIYEGNNVNNAPDLMIGDYDERYFLYYGLETESSLIFTDPGWGSGTHTSEGIFIACGNHIKSGGNIEGAEIIDLFPTFLYQLGLSIPSDVDGKVLLNIFDDDFIKDNKVKYGKVTEKENNNFHISKEDKKNIIERLKG
ncbi:MAG: alkaline phosphatase family protein, partial [Candidatus Bathyarchaeota archaeon]|nr:alkaline phosphatase family protein [Candidatus Bathyarchaeota archaeon]